MSGNLAILGLLAEGPAHGYALEALIEARGMRDWMPIGFSSIYQVLDELAAAALTWTHMEPAPGRGRPRRVHRITAKGRRHWSKATLSNLADPRCGDAEFLLALSALPLLDPAAATEAIGRRADALRASLHDLAAADVATQHAPPHVRTMFAYTDMRLRTHLTWIEHHLQQPQQPVRPQGDTL